MRGVLHRIGEDLEAHSWYDELVREVVEDVQAFAARWAAFEEFVDSLDPAAAED